MIFVEDIINCHDKIRSFIHRTPIFTNQTINELARAEIYFKCENFQKIGAFKVRGAMNAILNAVEKDSRRPVVTHSSGNHAQALAFAAKKFDLPAYIVMPKTAPLAKKKAVLGYGGQVIECEPSLDSREAETKKIMEEKGAVLIHPFDNDFVIAGQATAAKELIEDAPCLLDMMLVPVGGGGLLSGSALSTHYFSPLTNVIGAEPEGAGDAFLSFKSAKLEKAPYISTIADGLLTTLSERTLHIIRKHVSCIQLVSEREIVEAMRLIWERMKILVEPSSAVPLALVLKNKALNREQRIGIILTGGNVDLNKLPF